MIYVIVSNKDNSNRASFEVESNLDAQTDIIQSARLQVQETDSVRIRATYGGAHVVTVEILEVQGKYYLSSKGERLTAYDSVLRPLGSVIAESLAIIEGALKAGQQTQA